jgi:hypothetical protein
LPGLIILPILPAPILVCCPGFSELPGFPAGCAGYAEMLKSAEYAADSIGRRAQA